MAKSVRQPKLARPLPVPVQPELDGRPVEPDWKSFFQSFRAAHGMWPVVDGGRLLFPDGWSCAADSYAGPYLPPPVHPEDVIALQRRYWRRRWVIVKAERDRAEKELRRLRDLQRAVPGELTVFGRGIDEGDRVVRVPGQPMPWDDKVERLRWLIKDEHECLRELNNLGAKI